MRWGMDLSWIGKVFLNSERLSTGVANIAQRNKS